MVADAQNEVARSKMIRVAYGLLLLAAVAALLIYALRFAFPGGATGIERDPAETQPAEQAAPR
jgi:hypothetical protein